MKKDEKTSKVEPQIRKARVLSIEELDEVIRGGNYGGGGAPGGGGNGGSGGKPGQG